MCSGGWESPCLGEKGLDHRFAADETETQIRLRAPTSYSRSLKIQPPSCAGAPPSCPSFPWFLLNKYLSSFYNDQKNNPRQNLKMLNHKADSLECRPQARLPWSKTLFFSPWSLPSINVPWSQKTSLTLKTTNFTTFPTCIYISYKHTCVLSMPNYALFLYTFLSHLQKPPLQKKYSFLF